MNYVLLTAISTFDRSRHWCLLRKTPDQFGDAYGSYNYLCMGLSSPNFWNTGYWYNENGTPRPVSLRKLQNYKVEHFTAETDEEFIAQIMADIL